MSEILFQRSSVDAKLPKKGTSDSAAYDLYAAEERSVPPNSRVLISTGLKLVSCPKNIYLRIAPRSSLAVKGFDIGAGVVDSDYRGEVKVLFINTTTTTKIVAKGDRIAQMIPERIRIDLKCIIMGEETDATVIRDERGEGGFGSTQ